jgi:hypothetical protein
MRGLQDSQWPETCWNRQFQALKDLTPGRDDEKANNQFEAGDIIVPVNGVGFSTDCGHCAGAGSKATATNCAMDTVSQPAFSCGELASHLVLH